MKEKEFIHHLEKHRHEFYAYVRKMTWNPAYVDDIFSMAMMTAWEKRNDFLEGSNFKAWVYKIITHKCYNVNAKENKKTVAIEDVEHDLVDRSLEREYLYPKNPEQWLERCDDQIVGAFEKLTGKEKACFLLKSYEGFSYKEIAQIIDIPMGSVMTYLHRARGKLKSLLFRYAKEEGYVQESYSLSSSKGKKD